MMKRILSLVLVSIILFTSLSFSVDAQARNYAYSNEHAELLTALGVFDSSGLTGSAVSRAEFVRYAMKLAGIPVTPYKGTEFTDVLATHVDYGYIMSAVDFGLISIAETFRPEDTIAPFEAFKIIIHLLGYDFMASAKGGYPTGYLQTAQSIDLSDGIDVSLSAMTDYDVCTLLYNSLNVKLPETSYNGSGNDYTIGTATILQKYRGVLEIGGIVDGVSHYSSYNAQGLGEGRISINGTIYNTGSLNCDSMYGYDVIAYYDSNKKCLIACTPSDSNRVVSIYAEDVESFSGKNYVYADKDLKSKSVSLTSDATVFYNGRIVAYDASKMTPESGSLTFVSPNGSGAYSTLYIKSYKTIVVERTSMTDEYIVIDKYAVGDNKLVVDPDNVIMDISDQDGNELDFSSIAAGDVLNVAVSDDGNRVEIICVKDEIVGEYTGYSNDYIEIDGSEYRLSLTMKNKISELISLGKQAVFKLDIDKRIANVVPAISEGENIGYLVVGKLQKNGLTSSLAARVLNLDGNIYDYYFADSFSINGKVYKDYETAWNEHKSSDYNSLLCDVIKYTVNDEGKLKSIVYPSADDDNRGLYITNSMEDSKGKKLSQWFNTIGLRIVCSTSTKIFKVPNPLYSVDSVDDIMYSVEKASIFYDDLSTRGYRLVGYTTNPNDGMSTYLLAQKIEDEQASGVSVSAGAGCYMVNSITQSIVDGEVREKMELCTYSNTASDPYIAYSMGATDFSDAGITAGDVVRVQLNDQQLARAFEIVWKRGSSEFEAGVGGGTDIKKNGETTPEKWIRMVYPYSFRSDVLDVVGVDVNLATVTAEQKTPLYIKGVKILKYDDRLKSVVQIPVTDLKDYKSFGDMKSKIIYVTGYEQLQGIFLME